jgi:type III secretory pathway component EscT
MRALKFNRPIAIAMLIVELFWAAVAQQASTTTPTLAPTIPAARPNITIPVANYILDDE